MYYNSFLFLSFDMHIYVIFFTFYFVTYQEEKFVYVWIYVLPSIIQRGPRGQGWSREGEVKSAPVVIKNECTLKPQNKHFFICKQFANKSTRLIVFAKIRMLCWKINCFYFVKYMYVHSIFTQLHILFKF